MKRILILFVILLTLTACTQAEIAPTVTNTLVPPTATLTPIPPTATNTPLPTATLTPIPTPTATPIPPSVNLYLGCNEKYPNIGNEFIYNVYDQTYERLTNFTETELYKDRIGTIAEKFKFGLFRLGLDQQFIDRLNYDISLHDPCCFGLLAVSNDGKAALFQLFGNHTEEGSEEIVYWASIEQPRLKRIMKGYFNPWSVRDGDTFANDKLIAGINVFDVSSGTFEQFTDQDYYSGRISPDGSKAALHRGIHPDHIVTIVDISSKKEIKSLKVKNYVFDFSPDSDHYIYYDRESDRVKISSISSDETIEISYFNQLIAEGLKIKHVNFSPDGNWLVFWLGNDKAYTWNAYNLETNQSSRFENFELTYDRLGSVEWTLNTFYSFNWSPDGKWFVGQDSWAYSIGALKYSYVCSLETMTCSDYLVPPESKYDEKYLCAGAVWQK